MRPVLLVAWVVLTGCGSTAELAELASGGHLSCVRYTDGVVKCWGGQATFEGTKRAGACIGRNSRLRVWRCWR